MVRGIYWNYDGCARPRGGRWLRLGRILSARELNLGRKAAPYDLRQHRLGLNGDSVGDLYRPSCLVIDSCSQACRQKVWNGLDEQTATVVGQTLQDGAN